jgi:hemolysin III
VSVTPSPREREAEGPEAPTRLTLGPLHNPIRGLLHGSAALASLALAAFLWLHPGCAAATRLPLLVCALSQFALYLASSLYHSVPWGPVAKWRMQRLDHSMIYLGIAGAITPIVWLGLDGARREAILAAAWTIAVLGSAQKALFPRIRAKASIPFQMLQAGLALPALAPFAERCGGAPLALVLGAPVLFLGGTLVFLFERPRLWPRVFSHHELFHVCTVAGTGALYAVLLQLLAR